MKLLPLAAALLLSACTANSSGLPIQSDNAPDSASIKRVWMLTRLEGFSPNQITASKAQMNWQNLPQAGAYMGCNQLMFKTETQTDGTVSFGPVASTRMYCKNKMDLEKTFASMLPVMTRYQINGHNLILSGDGKEMHFVAQDWD